MGNPGSKPLGPVAKEVLSRPHVETPKKEVTEKACFAGGCFWGIELAFQRLPGVLNTTVGYTQGDVPRPSYQIVCSGTSGHTEALLVEFDPEQVAYTELCGVFWEKINPTQKNGQGNDTGTQYRTGIYYFNPEQQSVAEATKAEQQKKEIDPIATEILPMKEFFNAEENHQQYLAKNGQSFSKGCMEPIRCYG